MSPLRFAQGAWLVGIPYGVMTDFMEKRGWPLKNRTIAWRAWLECQKPFQIYTSNMVMQHVLDSDRWDRSAAELVRRRKVK